MVVEGPTTYTLRPKLPDATGKLYKRFLEDLRHCRRQDLCQRDVMRVYQRKDMLDTLPESDRLALRLFFEVLEDLARHGWQFDTDGDDLPEGTLRAIAPHVTNGNRRNRQEVKRRLRSMLVEARNEQLREPSVRRFVRKMERPHWHRGRQVSVQDLFANPQQFSDDLQRRLTTDASKRKEDLLYSLVDPYLQRATDDRDEFTNLRLRDVWRYCRYTWSLPQKMQPGRRMAYLVRDASRPFHPVMGIGALGSSIVQISCRDATIGWELEALEHSDAPAEHMDALRKELERAIGEIYRSDFVKEGLLSEEEIRRPTTEAIRRLDRLAETRPKNGARSRDVPLEEATRTPLYRHKRAKTLRNLLRAKRTFQAADVDEGTKSSKEQVERLLAEKEGRRALKTVLRSQKKRHVGSSMMNITTCGAIPPYNPVLGGKLAGLLMVSPQVVADYNKKYGDTSSHIASRMKGAPLRRRNELVLLETTSLYGVGSSQYNRLRAPAVHGEVRYHEVGQTDGYGSVHLSERTYRTVQQLLREHPELDEESHEFGRGVNYKMRSVSSALGHLGLGAVQEHQNPRLVYTIPLATNWKAYLTGRADEPQLLYDDVEQPIDETEALIDFWKRRWFIKRVQKPMIQRRLKKQRGKVRVSDFFTDNPLGPTGTAPQPNGGHAPPQTSTNGKSFMPAADTFDWTTLARLVGGRASFAERLSQDELAALHIRTKLDEGLVEAIRAGKRLYLTGNPGDGKTHFIKRHEAALAEADVLVHLDASATDEQALADELTDAIQNGRPAVIAINEGPLRQLKSHLPGSERNVLERQLDRPFLYGMENDAGASDALLVNLGLRQILARDTLDGALNMVLNHVNYDDAPEGIRKNHDMLKQHRVQERLKAILKRVAQSGQHVRMRNLLSFLAYIITGGATSADEVTEVEPYYQLAFEKGNALHDLIAPLDPSHLSHPLVDAKLWDGNSDQIQWLETPTEPVPVQCDNVSDAEAAFNLLKRRFYFEAEEGEILFEMIPEARQAFYNLLQNVDENRDTAKQDLLKALTRFFGNTTDNGSEVRLPIWTGLRYRADGPPSALIASDHLNPNDITLQIPRLRPEANKVIEYEPDHVRLQVRDQQYNTDLGINIDLSLWLELKKVARGMPPRFRDPLIERRIERFLAQVASTQLSNDRGIVQLSVRDIETGETYSTEVSLEQKKYRV